MISGIYAIVCKDMKIEELYIGSTCNLENRIYKHKYCCNNNNNLKVYQFIRENGGFDNFKFIVLEHYKGETEDLHQLERLWYETFPKELLLNINYPNRSKKEYREKNKEQTKQYYKEYFENNKEELNKKKREKTPCPKCLKSISKRNILRHLKVCKNTI